MMNERRYAVAVDGPSGAGKSTLAKAAAERLGILYVDTGAIYRTIGLYVQRRGHRPPRHGGGAGRYCRTSTSPWSTTATACSACC